MDMVFCRRRRPQAKNGTIGSARRKGSGYTQ